MKLTQANKSRGKKDTAFKPLWANMIRVKRKELGESQREFGQRFNVNLATVSHWELGRREAPYKVTWWLHWLERNDKNGS